MWNCRTTDLFIQIFHYVLDEFGKPNLIIRNATQINTKHHKNVKNEGYLFSSFENNWQLFVIVCVGCWLSYCNEIVIKVVKDYNKHLEFEFVKFSEWQSPEHFKNYMTLENKGYDWYEKHIHNSFLEILW